MPKFREAFIYLFFQHHYLLRPFFSFAFQGTCYLYNLSGPSDDRHGYTEVNGACSYFMCLRGLFLYDAPCCVINQEEKDNNGEMVFPFDRDDINAFVFLSYILIRQEDQETSK